MVLVDMSYLEVMALTKKIHIYFHDDYLIWISEPLSKDKRRVKHMQFISKFLKIMLSENFVDTFGICVL